MARIELTRIRTRIARRIAGLFVLCALGPLALLAAVTIWTLDRYLRDEQDARLRALAKDVAMDSVGRLVDIEARVRLMAAAPAPPGASSRIPSEARRGIRELTTHRRPDDVPGIAPALRARLASGESVLRPVPGTLSALQLLVPASADVDGARTVLAADLDIREIWGLEDMGTLSGATVELCAIRSPATVLVCTNDRLSGTMLSALTGGRGAGSFTLETEGREWLGAYWSAPLHHQFRVAEWTAVLMTRADDALAPTRALTTTFGLVGVATLSGVLLLSFHMIRGRLDPVERLHACTRRLADGDLAARAAVKTGDELEGLAEAVNAMAADLQEQFEQLHAYSVGTLEALARAIDAKSQWTAGHSTRVTELAVAIAAAMGLDDRARETIRRGALLHDIGKIAIPAEILDKPAPLTGEELTVVREHPTVGARILQPLPHCQAILPMVLQHHERLDGSGYPSGLRGDDIHLYARILSVADVFDAMTSRRPYRAGIPPALVVGHIAAGAGRQFDAVVVAALLRLLADARGPVLASENWNLGETA